MRVPRITLGNVLIAWFIWSIAAALALPPIDSRLPPHPVLKYIFLPMGVLLLAATPVAAFRYFNQAWRRASSLPNRPSYIIWLGLETSVAVGIPLLVYMFMHRG